MIKNIMETTMDATGTPERKEEANEGVMTRRNEKRQIDKDGNEKEREGVE